MTGLSLWEWLLVQFHLASPALRARAVDAAWRGERPSFGVRAVQRLLAAGLVLLPCLLLAWFCLPGLALLQGASEFLAAAEGLRSGSRTGDPSLGWSGPNDNRGQFRGAGFRTPGGGVSSGLTDSVRREIQRQHDRWQDLFGDDRYREGLKPRVLAMALEDYLAEIRRGNVSLSPDAWMARLTPKDIGRYTAKAERDWTLLKFETEDPRTYRYEYRPAE